MEARNSKESPLAGRASGKKTSPLSKSPFRSAHKTALLEPDEEIIHEECEEVSPLARSRTKSSKVTKEEIKETLKKSGIDIVEEVIVNNDEKQPELVMVKGYTKLGQPIFVEMDKYKNPTGISARNLTMMQIKETTVIPESIKSGNLENVEQGVVLECEGGVCVITKNPRGESMERTFVYVQAPTERAGVLGDNPLAAPITKVSEWVANPDKTRSRVNKETIEIRKSAVREMRERLEKAEEALKHMVFEFQEVKKCMEAHMNTTIELVEDMEKIQKDWLAVPECDNEEAIKKISCNQSKLVKTNNMIADELRCSLAVSSETAKLEESARKLSEYRSLICSNYKKLTEHIEKAI